MKPLKIFWTDRAANDLRQLHLYIQRDKPISAKNFIAKIKKPVERVHHFPNSGRMVPELNRQDMREIILENYRIIYKIEPKQIAILTVSESHSLLKLLK